MSHTVWKNVPHLNTYWGDIYIIIMHMLCIVCTRMSPSHGMFGTQSIILYIYY